MHHHMFCKVVHIITGLGALSVGLSALGYDVFHMIGRPEIAKILMYIVGLAGIVDLVMAATCAVGERRP